MQLRAALYLRVSTARQAEHDVSIPDQRRQGEGYCTSRGYRLVETYVEPGASATNDRRPEFQRMIEAGTAKPASFRTSTTQMSCSSICLPKSRKPSMSSTVITRYALLISPVFSSSCRIWLMLCREMPTRLPSSSLEISIRPSCL